MNKKPALITGGCGFVGRHLIDALLKRGESVWVVDNLFTGKHPDMWLTGFEKERKENHIEYTRESQKLIFVEEDVLDFFTNSIKERSKHAIPQFGDVFQLASIVGGRELIDGDPLLLATDIAIDSLLFVWATRDKSRVERLLYASSSAAYPVHHQTEDTQIRLIEHHISFDGNLGQPDMTYGWSKLTGEYLATIAAKKYGMHVTCIRPFSGYGEDQDLSYPFPAIAKRIARRENPVVVWGTGEQARDFIHIDDCISAMFVAIDKISDGSGINIGSGELTSFNTLIAKLSEAEGYKPEIKKLLDKPVGVHARHCDITKLTNLGWKPEVSLEDGIARMITYAKKHRM
jgi:UDP-glucose 4-epimerase